MLCSLFGLRFSQRTLALADQRRRRVAVGFGARPARFFLRQKEKIMTIEAIAPSCLTFTHHHAPTVSARAAHLEASIHITRHHAQNRRRRRGRK